MSATRTTQCRAQGGVENCTRANCPEKRAAMTSFFNGANVAAASKQIPTLPEPEVDQVARSLLAEEFTAAMAIHEDFGMFPYIDVDYVVERFRAHMVPPRTEDHNDKAAAKVLSNYIREAKQVYERRFNPSKFESREAYEAYVANPAAAPYVDLDEVIASLAEVLDRAEDTSEWVLL